MPDPRNVVIRSGRRRCTFAVAGRAAPTVYSPMPLDRNRFSEKAYFIWRGIALLISIEVAAQASKLEDIPVGPLLVAGFLWAFIGYKPKRLWVSAGITSICVMAAALLAWNLPKRMGFFIPVWG